MREKELEKLKDYKYGFSTDIENFKAPKGLNEEVIRFISKIKKEPQWLLDWRMKAFERLKVLKEPNWQKPKYPKIDYQDLYYCGAGSFPCGSVAGTPGYICSKQIIKKYA